MMKHRVVGTAAVLLTAATLLLLRRKNRWWLRQRWLRYFYLDESDTIDASAVRLVGGVDISFVKDSETEACPALVVWCEILLRCVKC